MILIQGSFTALMMAALKDNEKIVRLLLEAGASPDIVSDVSDYTKNTFCFTFDIVWTCYAFIADILHLS